MWVCRYEEAEVDSKGAREIYCKLEDGHPTWGWSHFNLYTFFCMSFNEWITNVISHSLRGFLSHQPLDEMLCATSTCHYPLHALVPPCITQCMHLILYGELIGTIIHQLEHVNFFIIKTLVYARFYVISHNFQSYMGMPNYIREFNICNFPMLGILLTQ